MIETAPAAAKPEKIRRLEGGGKMGELASAAGDLEESEKTEELAPIAGDPGKGEKMRELASTAALLLLF